jgi:hypothetical protein
VGASLASNASFDRSRLTRWIDPTITHEVVNDNLMIKAGEAPLVGDANRFEEPTAYLEVARSLRPLFLREAPPFLGRFAEEDAAASWFYRLSGRPE